MRKKSAAIILFLIVTFILSGCSLFDRFKLSEDIIITPRPSPIIISPAISETPKAGGTLRIAMRPPKTLNPLLNEDITVDTVLKLLFKPMMSIDTTFKPVENLASFNFASNGMSVSITLRDDSRWSDGMAITTRDIVYSLETLRNAKDTAIYKRSITNIAPNYQITNDKTIRLEFLEPFSGQAYQFCFPLIPEHYYKIAGNEENMNPIGNGLYVFTSYSNQKEMHLNLNPDTYRKKPYMPSITVLIVPDQTTEFHAFDQGLIDMASAEAADWGRYGNSKKNDVVEYITNYFDFIGFNISHPFLQDKRIREAIARCINIDDIVSTIYLGHAVKTLTPVNPNSWLYEKNATRYDFDLEVARGLILDTLANPIVNSDNSDVIENTTETTEAAENLEASNSEIFLRILVNEENEERTQIAHVLADNLNSVGIKTEIIKIQFYEYTEKLNNKDFDLFIGGYNLSIEPDLSFMFVSNSSYNNIFSFKDESLNALLANAFTAIGESEYKKAMSDAQKKIAEEIPCVSLVFRKSAIFTNQNVRGSKQPVFSNVMANINEWFLVQ